MIPSIQEQQESGFLSKSPNNQEQDSHSIMNKVANFIDSRQISIFDFWKSNRNWASANDIANFCKACGLNLPEYDVVNLKS